MIQVLRIPGTLPGLNELMEGTTNGVSRSGNKRHSTYSRVKDQWKRNVMVFCQSQGIRPVQSAHFRFRWIEAERRRDPDNIAAGGRKLILDGLKAAGIIPNDGWAQVLGFTDQFEVDKERQGVEITIISNEEA